VEGSEQCDVGPRKNLNLPSRPPTFSGFTLRIVRWPHWGVFIYGFG
jgi:hypothetical protein